MAFKRCTCLELRQIASEGSIHMQVQIPLVGRRKERHQKPRAKLRFLTLW